MDATKLDIFGFDVFGLCVEGVLLPRIWWIEENSKLAARRMPLNILLINYQLIHKTISQHSQDLDLHESAIELKNLFCLIYCIYKEFSPLICYYVYIFFDVL